MTDLPPLPDDFAARILASGDRSARRSWLADLPALVGELAERWELTLGEVLPLSWNYVVAARRSTGRRCILKLGPPWPDGEGTVREGLALRLAGPSAVELLEWEDDARALLLARASGGPLAGRCAADDDAATEILAAAMRAFWVPADEETGLPGLARLEETFEEFDRGPYGASRRRDLAETLGELDSGLRDLREAVPTARRVLQELLAEKPSAVLLHGDLHHGNVLEDGERGWVVIDPHGFVGDAAYDVAAMLYNPLEVFLSLGDPAVVARRRLRLMAELTGLDADILAAWGYVNSVLSMLWSLEVGEVTRDDPRMATMAVLRSMI